MVRRHHDCFNATAAEKVRWFNDATWDGEIGFQARMSLTEMLEGSLREEALLQMASRRWTWSTRTSRGSASVASEALTGGTFARILWPLCRPFSRGASAGAEARPMVFDVYDQLTQPGGRAVCDIDAAAPEGLGVTCIGPVRGRIELTNVGEEIIARGRVTATVELECMRCLRPFRQTVAAEIAEPCILQEIDEVALYAVDADEPDALPVLEGLRVNLSELVRQNLVVALPHRPLCADDCRGLCARCGRDLNEGGCGCTDEDVDPRLAGLKALLAERGTESDDPGRATGRSEKG